MIKRQNRKQPRYYALEANGDPDEDVCGAAVEVDQDFAARMLAHRETLRAIAKNCADEETPSRIVILCDRTIWTETLWIGEPVRTVSPTDFAKLVSEEDISKECGVVAKVVNVTDDGVSFGCVVGGGSTVFTSVIPWSDVEALAPDAKE